MTGELEFSIILLFIPIIVNMAETEKREMFELGFSIAVKIMAEAHSEKRTV